MAPPVRRQRPAVMADVAKLAGVSVPTVSRVLNGSAVVRPDKRDRVLDAIAELNFRPSATARALSLRQTRNIALLAGNTSHYGYAETIRGVEEAARAAGYTVSITVAETTDDAEVDRAIDLVLGQTAAGIVLLKFDPAGVALRERIPADVPLVVAGGAPGSDAPQAVLDEYSAAVELIEHLLSLGHRTVHHVRIPPSRDEDGRTTGWRRALADAGAPVPPLWDADWSAATGRTIGRALAEDHEVTAVFAGNDEIAMGVVRGLTDAGRRVPEDVSVVGFDDHPLAELWSPSLTTVAQDFAALGRRAFGLLLALLSDEDVPAFSADRPLLVLRDSTAPPPPTAPESH
ncbi:LacI family DNA-binding transcriptional regulator [Modestobacter sp. Leaf380]|uniref:LacI family DNA-binding transcriptional regulator n=1 Tax=Modestobacter sp. Leaf380 TaxID=1736356 RepID=UPI0006F88E41|nr:LacI family DNA-binding transcriptional regulator [Modestobacter sp. Leaf380]KQS66969.1 transcriptional regulator [Modestobacter sp. Leaf380]